MIVKLRHIYILTLPCVYGNFLITEVVIKTRTFVIQKGKFKHGLRGIPFIVALNTATEKGFPR